jgi:hypothetical protein
MRRLKSLLAPSLFGAVLILSASCLEPLTSDELDTERVFGDPAVPPDQAPWVDDDPLLAAKVAEFPSSVAYLQGYAGGEKVWYWNVGGPVPGFIAPIYELVGLDDELLGHRIIDVIPGDTGYSPWWRVIRVKVTTKYAGEKIWSREAIDEGIRLGILEAPKSTDQILNCPVVTRGTTVPLGDGKTADAVWGWYRKQRVAWVDFEYPVTVPMSMREMPRYPVYILQRVNEGEPLYEFLIGRDLNDDDDLVDSNNVFAGGLDDARYSPLWYVTFVRTVSEYVSIDNTRTGTVGLSSETQMFDVNGEVISRDIVPGLVTPNPGVLVNCPIQRTRGEL